MASCYCNKICIIASSCAKLDFFGQRTTGLGAAEMASRLDMCSNEFVFLAGNTAVRRKWANMRFFDRRKHGDAFRNSGSSNEPAPPLLLTKAPEGDIVPREPLRSSRRPSREVRKRLFFDPSDRGSPTLSCNCCLDFQGEPSGFRTQPIELDIRPREPSHMSCVLA